MELSEIQNIDEIICDRGVWAVSLQAAEEINAEIKDEAVARQFVLEELEAMSVGGEFAREFAASSGFKSVEYSGVIFGAKITDCSKPQFMLREFSLLIGDNETRTRVLCAIVDHTMRLWKLGKYKKLVEMNFEDIDELGV
ncbi:MAG: hypothetical protein LBU73_10255 [Helicobacteraceae bacterium]|jgi:hypothetical protein|nr:hypothetical protein [Helicobacteraceae bacterium]